jgi:hypothetical protein
MHFAVFPLSLASITISTNVDALACSNVVDIVACVFVAVRKVFFPFAMGFVVFPLSLIAITISINVDALACSIAVDPVACVFVAVRKVFFPFAMPLAVFPLSQKLFFYFIKRILMQKSTIQCRLTGDLRTS